MFVYAIERAAGFTRPIHSIMRSYGGKQIIPGAATLFFVNNEGCAVTCRHVAEMIMAADNINRQYQSFKTERSRIAQDGKQQAALKGLELKYKYLPETTIQLKSSFIDSVDAISRITCHLHPTLDLAIVKFEGYQALHYRDYARFAKDPTSLKQGKFLCRLGFPFPEFNNFRYNDQADDIEWTAEGNSRSPQFPIEGMVTRFLMDQNGLYGIEMSTPGLRGQSGGPLFDEKGIVYGMQSSTKHLHLGFDLVNTEILINNQPKKVSDYSFLHLGQCIGAESIKAFLRQHGVAYYEE